MRQIHPSNPNSTTTSVPQSNYEWLQSLIPASSSEAISFVKSAAEKAVIDLGMMGAAFDSSSESANRFTYAMYGAGAIYMLCDMLEKYPQMKNLGGEWQDFKSEFWKDKKESILNGAFAALGVAGTAIASQTSTDKAEGADVYKQIPAAVIAGAMSFLYLQSSKAIERVSAEKRTRLHEREVAEPFEQGIKDTILNLSGNQSQAQSTDDLLQELQNVTNNKVMQLTSSEAGLRQASAKITKLEKDIEGKDKDLSELTSSKDQLSDELSFTKEIITEKDQKINDKDKIISELTRQNNRLSNRLSDKEKIIAEKDQKITELSKRKETWQERVSQGAGNRPRGNSI